MEWSGKHIEYVGNVDNLRQTTFFAEAAGENGEREEDIEYAIFIIEWHCQAKLLQPTE